MKRPSLRRFRPRRKTTCRTSPAGISRVRPSVVIVNNQSVACANVPTMSSPLATRTEIASPGFTRDESAASEPTGGWEAGGPSLCARSALTEMAGSFVSQRPARTGSGVSPPRDRWRCPNPSADSGANRRMDDYQSGLPPAGGCQDYRLSSVGKGTKANATAISSSPRNTAISRSLPGRTRAIGRPRSS